ncbi:MAG TPA: xylose isomerase [Clostridiales bacterium]|nr:xylose isomerase [Clostridiales bacterium]
MAKFKVGCTLFSFTNEYVRGQLSLEDCIRTAAQVGAEGYEIVATQMIPSYPYVSDSFAGFIRECSAKYGIWPVCYAANMDRGMRRDRDLTEDEMLGMAINDLKSAHKLGCTTVRQQFLLSPNAMVRLAPYAEEYGIRVGIEIHNPETPFTPMIEAYREAYDKCNSPYIGFVPDFGIFATKPNKPYWDQALEAGVKESTLQMMAEMKYDEVPQKEAIERVLKIDPSPAAMSVLTQMYGFVQFKKDCRKELEGLKEIMPRCFEMHGKCHYIGEDLKEASIPYDEILPVVAESGYDGFIMTEFECAGDYSGIEMVKRHIAMERRIIKEKTL